jgi:hypothetical protein
MKLTKTAIRIRSPVGLSLPLGLVCIIFSIFPDIIWAQLAKPAPVLFRSFSGQFVVRATDSTRLGTTVITNEDLVRLEPNLATVSCERIKQLLFRELDINNEWRGKIYLTLISSETPAESVNILSERFPNSWQYKVELPDLIERVRYVRAIVQVLLLEVANRSNSGHAAEIPAWLSEGFAQQLLAANELEIILPPPRVAKNGLKLMVTNVNSRKINPVESACLKLKSRSPLSFYELSWPADNQWSADGAELYRSSAQLFVNQLLQLKDGRACMRALLSNLSQRLNWQLAFLDSFPTYFQRAVDIEKWWALQIVHLGRRDLTQYTWSFEESQHKLDEALHASMQIHTGKEDLPLQTTVPLSAVIRDSKNSISSETLQAKARELTVLRSRIAPEFAPLLERYSQALVNYLQHEPASPREVQDTIAQLEELDVLRAQVTPRQKAVAVKQP